MMTPEKIGANKGRLNRRHLRFREPELTQTGVTIVKLANAAGMKKKEIRNGSQKSGSINGLYSGGRKGEVCEGDQSSH